MTAIPTWRGRQVPWIAMWSAEKVGPTMVEVPGGWEPQRGTHWTRREHGMWMLAGPTRRVGEPDFASTHSSRQRRAMTQQLCQVCGLHTKGAMRWVVPDGGDHPTLWRERLVINAPVCEPCLELASRVCPHLAAVDPVAICAGRAPVVAVTGDCLVAPGRVETVLVPLRHELTKRMLGRELVVHVDG